MPQENSSTQCVDLKARFGRRYRIAHEDGGSPGDPWMQLLLCQRGHVFPYGGDTLAAATDSRGGTATKLASLACCTPVQDGDDGLTVVFPLEHFEQVAALMKPRRRRRLSPEDRDRLVEVGKSSRFDGVQSKKSAPGRDSSP